MIARIVAFSPLRAAAVTLLALLFALAIARPAVSFADENWVINSFDAAYEVDRNGNFTVTETIAVDFGDEEKHGIFRDIPYRYALPDDPTKVRITSVDVEGVEYGDGEEVPYLVTQPGAYVRIRIGDADETIDGEHTYVIRYTVSLGLNPFPDHDELFWNVTGDQWPVPILASSATVRVPGGRITQVACYEGPTGSTTPCGKATKQAGRASFATSGRLTSGEGWTIVVGIPKGAVIVAPLVTGPRLPSDDRSPGASDIPTATVTPDLDEFLDPRPAYFVIAGGTMLFFLVFALARWYDAGRDKRYTSLNQVTGETGESNRASYLNDTVVVEYTPPDDLRPAEIGVVLDERADTVDVSATIVDLAARGYLSITELEKKWLFGKKDYQLDRLKEAGPEFQVFEQRLFTGLFEDGPEVKLSELKNKFYKDLAAVKKSLYSRVVDLKFFPKSPDNVRSSYRSYGRWIMGAGVALSIALAMFWGAGIAALGLIPGGFILARFAGVMPARTSKGREAFRRSLGFKKFIEVADKSRQEFYEQAGLFERYLPYAMVFGSVQKWANVFKDLDIEIPAPSYYHGYYAGTYFNLNSFTSSMNSFSGTLGSTIASTPGGAGGSGFSGGGGGGGFSGGGGGGGGGGSW